MSVLGAEDATAALAAPALDATQLESFPALERLAELSRRGSGRVGAGNLWGSSQALVLAALVGRAPGPWLVIASTDADAESLREDLETFGADATFLPAREGTAQGAPDLARLRERLAAAQRMAGPPERRPRLLVASLLSLLQPLPSPRELERDLVSLQLHQELDAEDLLRRLVQAGYVRQPLAERPGELSLRGEILDVYPFAAELPLRIEFFGEEIESLRVFDPENQRSVEILRQASISLASDAGDVEQASGVPAWSLAAPGTVVVRIEPLRIEDQAEGLRIRSQAHARALLALSEALAKARVLDLQSLPGDTLDFETRSVQALAVGMKQAPEALAEAAREARVIVLCRTEAERARLAQIFSEHGLPEAVQPRIGGVARGFRLPSAGLVVVNQRELVGIEGAGRSSRARASHLGSGRVRAIQSFFELKLGDLVVHAVHGVARFAGLVRMRRGEGEEEHLHLLFADDVALYVPASRIDMVQRYIGTGVASPTLDKIGGQAFRRRKEKVERALFDLAGELLEIQARRALQTRPRWVPPAGDDELVRALLASFPWTDTADQARADGEIRADLQLERAMDRLLCGDVGFGKTELAVRAAFRVVHGGGQVAVLVPTTLLAQQHYDTFRERLADFPVEIGRLSRYVPPSEAREVVARLGDGRVDVVIGTHRLLSQDVRFARLGLVVIDEEQRFGVAHKEHFKRLRAQVDVLALSATPIPRTLHMSLSGLRDISALTIPPDGRQEIETRIVDAGDETLLREALLAERQRGGQVFFLHNRVQSIEIVARRVARLVPECRIGIGHGQMSASELERVMRSFTRGEIDVLVATTIVESGLDIPAAGTIVVDQAQEFGLSELHQLRGRVGRGTHKARCLLLVDPLQPIPDVARKRLKALEEMNHLGAGFAISMKDLEIRGAGNLLGPEQSGHIAAIGYDMYCRLLKQTVERLQAGGEHATALERPSTPALEEQGCEVELGLPAFLPESWIPSVETRLELLRELSSITTRAEAAQALETLRDRFGRVPGPAQNLVRTFLIQAALTRLGVRRLLRRDGSLHVEFDDRLVLERWLAAAPPAERAELRSLRTGVARLEPPRRSARDPRSTLAWLERRLQAEVEHPTIAP